MKAHVKLVAAACLIALMIVLVGGLSSADGPAEGRLSEVAYPHTIRLKVVEATPLERIRGTQLFELKVERFYGKIEQRSYDRARKHETQRFTILFPAAADANIKAGDVIDYAIAGYLSSGGDATEPDQPIKPLTEVDPTNGVPQTQSAAKVVPPRQPGGVLGRPLGSYLTIEGEGVQTKGLKIETGTVAVDTINGEKLAQPVRILLRNLRSPLLPGQRFVLKGYETGAMIGVPSAALQAAEEQGRDDVHPSPVEFQWRPFFVGLIAVEPAGLELLQ